MIGDLHNSNWGKKCLVSLFLSQKGMFWHLRINCSLCDLVHAAVTQ